MSMCMYYSHNQYDYSEEFNCDVLGVICMLQTLCIDSMNAWLRDWLLCKMLASSADIGRKG